MGATSLDLIAIQTDSTGYAGTFRALIGAGTSNFDGAYSSLSGIPSTFAPSSHTHPISNISDLGAGWSTALAAAYVSGSASTSNPLSQFAATTSAQLRGVLTDETGTGVAVFATSPSLATPAIAGATLSSNVDVVSGGKIRFLDSGAANRGEISYDATFGGILFGAAFGNGVKFGGAVVTGPITLEEAGGALNFGVRFTVSQVSSSLTINNVLGNDFAYQFAGTDVFRIAYSTNVLTYSGQIKHQIGSGSSDPTSSNFASGLGGWWKNTTSGEIRFWHNDGGTMKKSAALTT